MTVRCAWLTAACLFAMAGGAVAQTEITFQDCADADGRSVATVRDTSSPTLATVQFEGGVPVIRYNPTRLPDLSVPARVFFYARECVRLNRGELAAGPAASALRDGDCGALETMLRSGLIRRGDVPQLQRDLALPASAWAEVAGPARHIDLAACVTAIDERPSLTSPPASQDDWNTCLRACADPLLACRARGGDGCQSRYEQCSALCDFRHPL